MRDRAHLLLASLGHPTDAAAGRAVAVDAHQRSRWRARFLADGGSGFANRKAPGRTRKLDADAEALLRTARAGSPLEDGYGVATWTVADRTDLREQQGWPVHRATVSRQVHRLGYVYRRPRHDLQQHQDAEAVARAAHTLAVLQKKGLLTAAECGSSTSTNAISPPIPTWQHAGNVPAHLRRGAPTSG